MGVLSNFISSSAEPDVLCLAAMVFRGLARGRRPSNGVATSDEGSSRLFDGASAGAGIVAARSLYEGNWISASSMEQSSSSDILLDGVDMKDG